MVDNFLARKASEAVYIKRDVYSRRKAFILPPSRLGDIEKSKDFGSQRNF